MKLDKDLFPSRPVKRRGRKIVREDEILFSEFFDRYCQEHFDGSTWGIWKVVGKALFSEPLTPDELLIFGKFTGRTQAPTKAVREIWLQVGRRGGKGKFSAAVVVYLACFKKRQLKPGELARVMLMAMDKDQAREVFGYVESLIDSLSEVVTVVARTKETLDLDNRIQIMIRPADRRRVRGRTLLAAICDEIAHWWSDDINANPDNEVLRAVRPSMLGVKDAMLLCISSPYARKGSMWETFKKYFAKNDDRVLYWKASTQEMRPDDDPDFLAELKAAQDDDPVAYEAEYLAEFRRDVETFISQEVVAECTAQGKTFEAHQPGIKYYPFVDVSGGGGQDSCVLAIARWDGVIKKAIVCRICVFKPPFNSVEVAKAIVGVLEEYELRTLQGDHFGGDTWAGLFKDAGLTKYVVEPRTKSELFLALQPILNGRRVELLDHPECLKELLALERSTSKQGKDTIGHPRGRTDDIINAVAGAVCMADLENRKAKSQAVVTSTTFTTDGRVLESGQIVSSPNRRPSMLDDSIHPHERPDPYTAEADVRMGAAKARGWRAAWSGKG